MNYKMSTIYRYPNAWRSPYSMARDVSYARGSGKLYLAGAVMALGITAAFGAALVSLFLSAAECAVFMTLSSVMGAVSAGKSFFAFRHAKRLDDVHAVWMEMFEAPYRWRELALSRKAYAYAQQDDALRFILAATITGIGALGLVGMAVLAMVAAVHIPALAWVWFAASLCVGSGAIVLWGINQRRLMRMELEHVLGQREIRPPDMRLFPHRHGGGEAA